MKRFLFYLMAIIFALQGWAQVPATLPYSCDFETQAEVAEWTLSNSTSTNKWAYGQAANGGVINGNSLFVSNDGISYNYSITNAGTVTASRIFISQGAVNYQLSFDLNIGGESSSDYLKIYVLPKDSVYNGAAGTSYPFFAVSGFTSPYLVSKNGTSNFLNLMQNKVFLSIPNTIMGNAGDTMKLVFVWKNDGSIGTQPPAAIDNLSINYTTCDSPTDLAVPSATITSNSAIVNWTASSSNSSFTLEYKKASQTWAQAQTIQNASTGLMLTSLDPNTLYNIRLKADCFGVEGIYVLSNFKTSCGNITSYPWFEGFETTWAAASGLSNATTPDNCWININGGASTSYLWRKSSTSTVPSYVRTGTGAAQLYGNTTGIMGDYLITPVFTLSGNEKINFWAKGYTSTTKYNEPIWIKVYNVTQNGDIASNADTTKFIDLAFINDTNQSTWNNYEYSLKNYTGNYRIVFARSGVSNGYYFQMDDLTISQEGVCANPYNIKASNPHSTSVDISFTPAKPTDNSWVIYYNNVSTSVWDSVLCTTTNFTLTGLTPNIKYAFAIKTNCSSNLSNLSPIRYFQTTCSEISTLPWSDSFDSYGTGTTAFPACWSKNTTLTGPYVNTTNFSSPGSFYFYSATANTHIIAATPPFSSTIPINTLLAKFKYRNANMNNFICVGAMSNPSDETTFVCIDTIRGTVATTWEDFQVSFASYTGNGNYIAFKLVHNGITQTGYIDDLIIDAIPNCQAPTVFSANNVTSNTIDIVWTPADVNHSMWYLYYKESTATNYDSVLVSATPQHHLSGLTPNTTYDYYLVTFCGNEYSPASFSGSFTTTCFGISSFPHYESFDNWGTGTGVLPNCWMRNSSIATAPNISTTNNTPPGSLYLFSAAGNRTVGIMVIDSVTPINTLRVKFKMRYTSFSSYLQVGVMTDPNDFSTFVPVGAKQSLNQASVWEEKEVLLDSYTGNGRFLAFVSTENASNYVYMDDLVVDYIPLCKKPTNITISNLSTNSATVAWTEGSFGDIAWFLYYKEINDSDWDSVYVSGTPSYNLINLNSGSQYEVYVKTDCGFDYSEPSLRPYVFTTNCGTISSFPYTESFDNWGTGTGKYPMCWTKSSSTYANPYISTTYNSAPGALYYATTSTNSRATAVLPPVDNSINVNTLMIKFKMNYSSTSTALPIQVGVMTDSSNWATFTPVGAPQTISVANTWEDKIVMLDSYTGNGKYIALSAVAAATNYIRIDDVEVDVIPSCSRPDSVTISNITTNSANISWVPDSPSDVNFKVYYKKSFDNNWDSVMTSSTSIVLTNLVHSTNYDIEVRTQCSNGSFSDGFPEYFMTSCGDITSIPYYESFDNWGTGTGKYPNCWTRNSSVSGAPYVNTTSFSAPGCLYFYSISGNRATAILPAIDINIPINTLKLKFKMQYSTIYDGLQVGIMTDTTNINTFTPIGLKQSISATSIWEDKEVSFNDYTGLGRYIAIMSYDTNATNYARIDDLVVDYIPACANPTDLFVNNITVNSAIINWKNGNTYDNAWWLYYKESSSVNYDSIYITTNPYTLQSLTVDTYYDYYIVTDCGVQLSSPSVKGKFKTACLPITSIPYTESFDTYGTGTGKYPSCWYRISQYSTTPYINTTNFSSPGSLYLSGYNGANAYAIFGPIDNTISLDTLILKFKLYYSSAGYAEIQAGVMTDPYNASTFVPVGNLQTQIAAGVWEDKEIALASYTGTGRYIALKTNSPSTASSYNYTYVDNVVLDYIPACAKPSNLHITNLTSTSAQIAWTNGNVGNTAWKLYYKPTTAMGYDSVSITTPSPYNLIGLTPQTEYQYYMRTDCGTEVSEATIIHNFTTPCSEITTLPWVEGFETYGAAGSFPPCWSRPIIYSTYPKTSTTASRVHNGTSSLEIHSALTPPTYAITPAFGHDINTLRVKFWAMAESITSSGTLEVGVMSNPNDVSTFESVSIIQPLNTSYNPYEITFANTTLTGLNKYIAFRQNTVSTAYYYWIDDVEVSLIPSCSAPTNLVVSNFDTNQVNVSWTNGDSTDNAWWLYYKTSSNLFYDSVYINSPSPYTLTNLTPSTEYSIYMRTDCGTKLSEQSLVSSFYTACPSVSSFPWTEGFNNSWINTVGVSNAETPNNCWVNINGANATYKWRATTTASYVRTGTGSAQLYASNNVMSDYLFTPKFNFTGNERLRFWYKNYPSTAFYPENVWVKAYNVTANGDIDNASDTTLLVTIGYISDTNNYSWKEYELNLTSLVGEYRIAFVRDSNSKIGYYFHIDDMIIDVQPSCKRPTNLTATNVQHTTATISWTSPSATQTSWILYYQDMSSSTYDSVIVNNANTYTLTNLNSGATYGYLMVSLCGTNVSEQTNPLFFTTICNSITSFPWMEGFENSWVNGTGVSNDMVPNTCWVNINGGASLTYKWRKNATTTVPAYARTGSGSAQLYGSNQSMGDYLLTPIITFTGNEQIEFWGKGYSSTTNYPENVWIKAYNVTLNGEIDSYSDTTLFTNVAFINDTNQYTWKNYIIPLTGLVGDYRLVFGRNNSVGYYYHIDDLVVDKISACPRPDSIATSNITINSVELSWKPGTITDAAWKIYYRIEGTLNWDSVHVTSNPYVLTGLQSSSKYEIGIATDCGTGAFSNIKLGKFETLCGALNIPTPIESFVTVLPNYCWARFTGQLPSTGNATLATSTSGWSANSNMTPHNIRVNLYSTSQYFWLVTPSVDLSNGSTSNRLEFDLFLTQYNTSNPPNLSLGYNNKRFIVLISTDNGATWSVTNSLKTWDNSGSQDTLNSLTNIPKHISIPLVDATNTPYSGIVKFAFYGESTVASQGDNNLHIDNFQVIGQGCDDPTNINANNITSTSANISWTPGGNETAWQIKQGSAGVPIDLTNNQYQATGLTPNTSYTYYVRSNCSSGTFSSWIPVTFVTLVMPVDPQVSTSPVTVFNHNSATFTGSYTAGTDAITAIGFVYKVKSANTWINIPITPVVSPFTFNATSLTPNTTYQVRAFATTASGTFYGDTSTFTTNQLLPPTVTTTNVVVNNGAKSATFQGTTSPGTEAIIARGFEYKYDTSSWTKAIDLTATGSTSISATATGLIIANYNVRAYAETNSGKIYGDVLNFAITSSIEDINKDNLNVNLYPNPASNNTTLSIKGVNGKVKISITDVQGRTISTLERESTNGEVNHSINLETYAKGVYYIRIQSDNSIKTQKLIVQ